MVFKINGKEIKTWTDSWPNNGIDEMIDILKGMSKQEIENVELEFVENNGGGANSEYIENIFEMAQNAVKKGWNKNLIKTNDERLWHNQKVIEQCDKCQSKPGGDTDDWNFCESCGKTLCPNCQLKTYNKIFCDEKCKEECMIDQL